MRQIPCLQKCFSLVAACVLFVSLVSAQDAISTITTALHAHDYRQAAELARGLGAKNISLSLTHTAAMAMAMVILEGD